MIPGFVKERHTTLPMKHSLTLLTALLFAPLAAACAEIMVLPQFKSVHAPSFVAPIRTAAENLRDFLKARGVDIPMVTADGTNGTPVAGTILLGTTADTPLLARWAKEGRLSVTAPDSAGGAYEVAVLDGVFVVNGASARAVLYGVFELEDVIAEHRGVPADLVRRAKPSMGARLLHPRMRGGFHGCPAFDPRSLEPKGSWYEVEAPDMLDLAKHARLNRAPNYNPRVAFEQSIMPMLEQERAGRKATVMCYTVACGPTHGPLRGNRAFPIIAFGKGFTGVSHWAYNDSKGGTWHPWDGTEAVNLDYILVHDGTENHPFNRAWNPTGETRMPSIRWEALRAGIQDAYLLTWLKAALEQGRLRGEEVARARACLDTARLIAEGKTELTDAAVARLSRELREVYVASGL